MKRVKLIENEKTRPYIEKYGSVWLLLTGRGQQGQYYLESTSHQRIIVVSESDFHIAKNNHWMENISE